MQLQKDVQKIKYSFLPGIGAIPVKGDYGEYHIGELGQRLIPPVNGSVLPKRKLLILGSSQSFGYINTDADNLGAQLSRMLPDVEVTNCSIPGQFTLNSLFNWKRLSLCGYHYDVVILLNGIIEAFTMCNCNKPKEDITHDYFYPALITIAKKVMRRLRSHEQENFSLEDNTWFAQVFGEKVKTAYELIIDFGRQEKTLTYIFIPPSPYGNNASTDNLMVDPLFRTIKPTMDQFVDLLSQMTQDMDGVTDLSHIFDDEAPMFLDPGGHLTPQGNRILAEHVVKKLTSSGAL